MHRGGAEQTPPPLPATHSRPSRVIGPADLHDFQWSETDMKMKVLVEELETPETLPRQYSNSETTSDDPRYVRSGDLQNGRTNAKSAELRERRFRRLDRGVLCRVTVGYRGDDPMYEISADEMYWLCGIERQRRMVTRDSKGRYLSIPLKYKRKFNRSYDGCHYENHALTLTQIRDEMKQSTRVPVLKVENDEPVLLNIGPTGPSGKPAERLGPLTFVDTYDEKYIIALPVANGEVSCETSSIPVHMTIEVTLAEGFDPKAKVCDKFQQWMNDAQQVVNEIESKMVPMCQEIIMFNKIPDGNNEYDYIKPAAFIVDKGHLADDGGVTTRTYEEILLTVDKKSTRHIDQLSGTGTLQRGAVKVRSLPKITHITQNIRSSVVIIDDDDIPPPLPTRTSSVPHSPTDVNEVSVEPPQRPPNPIKRQPSQISKSPHGTKTGVYEQCCILGPDQPSTYMKIRPMCPNPSGPGNLRDEVMTSWVDLSTSDLLRYLRMLDMDEYTATIESKNLDGKRFASMSEEFMKTKLNIAPKDAALLRTFIEKDWYPPFKCNSS